MYNDWTTPNIIFVYLHIIVRPIHFRSESKQAVMKHKFLLLLILQQSVLNKMLFTRYYINYLPTYITTLKKKKKCVGYTL